MKKCIFSIVTLFLITLPTMNAIAEGTICDSVDINWINAHVPVPPGEIIDKTPLNGLCQVILRIQGQLVPVFTGENFVLAGEMFQDRKQMTEAKINTLKTTAMKDSLGLLENVVAMSYAPANANGKIVYMLTDPLCPYCNTAGEQLKSIADETGATFKLVMANVHGNAGEKKIKEALCKQFTFEQYVSKEWKLSPPEQYECSAGSQFWAESNKVVGQLGIGGLPAFITQDGQLVSGANMPAVKKVINNMVINPDEKALSENSCNGNCGGACQKKCSDSCTNPCSKKQG